MDEVEFGFGVLAKRIKQTSERSVTNNKQRRYLVSDDVDKEFSLIKESDTSSFVLIPISLDMSYIERWSFKIVKVNNVSINYDSIKITIDGIDLTAELLAQFDKPKDNAIMYPDETMSNKYDIMKAVSVIDASKRSQILKQGYHKLRIESNNAILGLVRVSQKLSFVNRQGV